MDQFNRPPSSLPTQPLGRPSVAPLPIQRGNFGIPVRQSAMTPPPAAPTPVPSYEPTPVIAAAPVEAEPFVAVEPPVVAVAPPTPTPLAPTRPIGLPAVDGPRYMDMALPQQQPAPTQPIMPTVAPVAQRPLFTPSPTAAPASSQPKSVHIHVRVASVIRWALVVLASLLLIAGIARWVTAGNITDYERATSAVSANDGQTMTVQFTATDGKLHKLTTTSIAELIPGSATEVAYRSGAPEASARLVAVVDNARNLGYIAIIAGIALLGVAGVIALVTRHSARNKQRTTPLTTPVAV